VFDEYSRVNLQNMLRNSSQKFDNLKSSDNYEVRNKINEIKGSESEWKARIEVPYKPDCRIM